MKYPELAPLVKRARLDDPYIAAGDRAYVIGTQDGGFPVILLGFWISGTLDEA